MIDSVSWSVGRSVACVARVSKLIFLAPRGIGQTKQNWRAGREEKETLADKLLDFEKLPFAHKRSS